MKKIKFWFGLVVTVLWLLFAGWIISERWDKVLAMDLNLLGDTFAGFFAPLAFLWLVLGYLQQGDELRLSTDALRLQAEELKNSVQQQKDLVQVTQRQVEASTAAFDQARSEAMRAAQPLFLFSSQYRWVSSETELAVDLKISNEGASASNITFKLDPKPLLWQLGLLSSMARGFSSTYDCRFQKGGPNRFALKIEYLDSYDREVEQSFDVQVNPHGESKLVFTRLGMHVR